MKKACATVPSLIEPENIKSYRDVSWFESFEYLDTKGLLIAKIDKHILPYLIVFHQYTRIKLSHVLGFKYDYTCDAYIYFKLRLHTKSFNEISINMSIAEFKEKINMTDSYLNSNSMFNKIVLKNLEKEINEATDINFRYELCKTNKKYTSILIYIKNKKTYSNPDAIEVSDHMQAANNKCSLSGDSTTEDTTFISITKLGISVKKAKSIYSQYGEYKTSQAINKLQNEVKKGVVINNAAGYLIGILNNACSNVDSNDISKFQQKKEEESKLSSIEFEENWNSIETHLYKSQEILESLYKILESKDKIYEQVHIECLDQIKMILDINPELLSSLRPFTQVFIKNGTMCVTMPILQQIAHDIKIASDIERLSYFKERLDLKVRKIDLISEPLEKELLLSEIETLKSQLYSLI
jgi:plasmid replication initiation protein